MSIESTTRHLRASDSPLSVCGKPSGVRYSVSVVHADSGELVLRVRDLGVASMVTLRRIFTGAEDAGAYLVRVEAYEGNEQ